LGALPERAGGAGLATRAGDAADLAAAMLRLVDEPSLWGALRGNIPAPSPSVDEHVDAMLQIYAKAKSAPQPKAQFPMVTERRRLAFLMKQRDTAMSKLLPPSGGSS